MPGQHGVLTGYGLGQTEDQRAAECEYQDLALRAFQQGLLVAGQVVRIVGVFDRLDRLTLQSDHAVDGQHVGDEYADRDSGDQIDEYRETDHAVHDPRGLG